MNQIEELKKIKEQYVKTEAQKIIDRMAKGKMLSCRVDTCDMIGYGWDRELHRNFPAIAEELRKQGFRVTCAVNWGVTDWTITVE